MNDHSHDKQAGGTSPPAFVRFGIYTGASLRLRLPSPLRPPYPMASPSNKGGLSASASSASLRPRFVCLRPSAGVLVPPAFHLYIHL